MKSYTEQGEDGDVGGQGSILVRCSNGVRVRTQTGQSRKLLSMIKSESSESKIRGCQFSLMRWTLDNHRDDLRTYIRI